MLVEYPINISLYPKFLPKTALSAKLIGRGETSLVTKNVKNPKINLKLSMKVRLCKLIFYILI